MQLHRLEQEQVLPLSLEEAWTFFSNPRNLNELTPPNLSFRIVHCPEGVMFEGEIITYRIKVLPFLWVNWVTEIKAVTEQAAFIDEQRAGPYRFWHHRHTFEEVPEGVLMKDVVHYAIGMGVLGEIAHAVFVRRKLERVFGFRREVLTSRFSAR